MEILTLLFYYISLIIATKIIIWALFDRSMLVKRIQHEADKYIVSWILIAVKEYKKCIK